MVQINVEFLSNNAYFIRHNFLWLNISLSLHGFFNRHKLASNESGRLFSYDIIEREIGEYDLTDTQLEHEFQYVKEYKFQTFRESGSSI